MSSLSRCLRAHSSTYRVLQAIQRVAFSSSSSNSVPQPFLSKSHKRRVNSPTENVTKPNIVEVVNSFKVATSAKLSIGNHSVAAIPADFVALSVGPPVQNRNSSPPPSAPLESDLSPLFWPYSQTIETAKPVSSFADMGLKQQLPNVHDDSQIQIYLRAPPGPIPAIPSFNTPTKTIDSDHMHSVLQAKRLHTLDSIVPQLVESLELTRTLPATVQPTVMHSKTKSQ